MATVSDTLRAALERCGLTRYAVSKATGIPESVLSRFAHGQPLRGANLDKLCAHLGLVLMTEGDYESLCIAARRASDDDGLPPFPSAKKDGSVPAIEYARVSIARDLIRARRDAGLSQQALADLAGLRQETLSRIETAKHSATPATIGKIERAIAKAIKTRKAR